MRWEIQIDGPRAILRQLALVVSDNDIRLVRRDDHFFLSGSLLDSCGDIGNVRCEAGRIITLLSGSARLSLGSTESLHIGVVTACEKITDREPIEDSREAPRTRKLDAVEHRSISQANGIRGNGGRRFPSRCAKRSRIGRWRRRSSCVNAADLNWVELVTIYNVIEEATGGRPAVASFSGVTENAIKRLHQTAKSVAGAEDGARDDRGTQPTSIPMTLTEARSFIDHLLMSWFASVTLSRTRVPLTETSA